MKKLLVLALAVVLVLSLTVVASAATFDPSIGGRLTWAYASSDSDDEAVKNDHVTLKNSGVSLLLKGTVSDEETGTWATIGAKFDNWDGGQTAETLTRIWDLGIKNIGESNVSVWYTNHDNGNMKRGQDRIRGLDYAQYHRDPMFDHGMSNVIGVDYNSDTVDFNLGYVPDKANDDAKNETQVAATFKFDGGKAHVGHFMGTDELTESIIGGEYKFGFATTKLDYLTKEAKDADAVNQYQVAAYFDLGFDVTLLMDDKYSFGTDGGMGYQIRYTGIDNVVIGYAALQAEEEADEGNNMTDLFIGYKYGVLETRFGMGTKGEGDTQEKITYVSAYASLW